MKIFSILVAVACALDTQWEKFKKEYNKVYKNEEEEQIRHRIFDENMMFINSHQSDDYTVQMNKFTDMNSSEFSNYLSLQIPPQKLFLKSHIATSSSLPNSVDWRGKGVLTPVKNQGMCGSCFAFSAIESIESAWAVKHKELVNLSEQQVLDCDHTDHGCRGGFMTNVFDYAKNNDLCTSTTYDYDARQGQCKKKCSVGLKKGSVTGYVNVGKNERALQSAISLQPVSVAIQANQLAFQFYHSGVLTGSCGRKLDHGVQAVGYGETNEGSKYWIVRNSWGEDWGEEGYVRIERGKDECGILDMASYPMVSESQEILV